MVSHCQRGESATIIQAMETNNNDAKLLEAQTDIVEMAHTALGHLEALKKKELALAATAMTNGEFGKLAADRKKMIVELAAVSSDDHPNFDASSPGTRPR